MADSPAVDRVHHVDADPSFGASPGRVPASGRDIPSAHYGVVSLSQRARCPARRSIEHAAMSCPLVAGPKSIYGDPGQETSRLSQLIQSSTRNGRTMSDVSIDQLGPVDYLVVEFPANASNFTGEMLKELTALVEGGTIRVIDMLILKKDADGGIDVVELEDLDELGELQSVEAELAEMLAEDDVVNLAAAMEPGSTAGVLIWENLWAAPFASAARRSGGQLIANGRIPIQGIIAAIEADEAMSSEGA